MEVPGLHLAIAEAALLTKATPRSNFWPPPPHMTSALRWEGEPDKVTGCCMLYYNVDKGRMVS